MKQPQFKAQVKIRAQRRSAKQHRKTEFVKKIIQNIFAKAEEAYKKSKIRVRIRHGKLRSRVKFERIKDAKHFFGEAQWDPNFAHYDCKIKFQSPITKPKKLQTAPLMRFLHVKVQAACDTELQTKLDAKQELIQITKDIASTRRDGFAFFRVSVKRNRKLVAIVKFLKSSDADFFFKHALTHTKMKNWKCQVLPLCFQRQPLFHGHLQNFKRKKETIFKDRDVLSAEGFKALKDRKERAAIKRKITGSMQLKQFPALQDLVRKKRREKKEKKLELLVANILSVNKLTKVHFNYIQFKYMLPNFIMRKTVSRSESNPGHLFNRHTSYHCSKSTCTR